MASVAEVEIEITAFATRVPSAVVVILAEPESRPGLGVRTTIVVTAPTFLGSIPAVIMAALLRLVLALQQATDLAEQPARSATAGSVLLLPVERIKEIIDHWELLLATTRPGATKNPGRIQMDVARV